MNLNVRVVAPCLLGATLSAAGLALPVAPAPDARSEKWVRATLARLTLDEKVGQLITSHLNTTYLSTDSDRFEAMARLVREHRIGGFHAFGGTEPAPSVLLNPTYGTVVLGHPLAAASLTNRLQAASALPLLFTADFENGAGQRLQGATSFPRAMAFGAARDEKLAFEAGRVTAVEARALGIHVNFAPVVDVNNNARNPVINTRSFGEDPALVGALASAYVRGLQAGGALATLKHFPGHGDTDVDSHLGLPLIAHPRERLEKLELVPFRAGISAGADAVMSGHIELPAIDPAPGTPATLSRPAVTGLLRGDLGFGGLVYTDSMAMHAVSLVMPPGPAAVKAIKAGNDVLLLSPDDAAAIAAIKGAITSGEIPLEQIDRSVERILRAKARLGLQRNRLVALDAVPGVVGTRAHAAIAWEASRRSLTLVKDERNQVPLPIGREGSVLYLSVLDYPGGWRIGAPSRTFLPALQARWPAVTAVEVSDRTTQAELDLVRAMAPRFDAIVASVFVRTASYSGRMDLAPPVVRLLQDLARQTAATKTPFATVLFGNPYIGAIVPELPTLLLTYDFYDLAEASAVSALAGEAPISGRLPIGLPGMYPVGHGLDRAAVTAPMPHPTPTPLR